MAAAADCCLESVPCWWGSVFFSLPTLVLLLPTHRALLYGYSSQNDLRIWSLSSQNPHRKSRFLPHGHNLPGHVGRRSCWEHPLLLSAFLHSAGRSQGGCFASPCQSDARTASVQGKWPPGFCKLRPGEGKPPPAGGDSSCNTGEAQGKMSSRAQRALGHVSRLEQLKIPAEDRVPSWALPLHARKRVFCSCMFTVRATVGDMHAGLTLRRHLTAHAKLRDTVSLLEAPQCEQVQDEAPPDRHRAAAAADVCWAGATEPSY